MAARADSESTQAQQVVGRLFVLVVALFFMLAAEDRMQLRWSPKTRCERSVLAIFFIGSMREHMT